MVVLVVHRIGVAISKGETDSPVAGDPHTPAILELAFEPVQTGAGVLHVLNCDRCIEPIQDVRDSLSLLRLNATLVPITEKPL